jgi:hypothetical protein
MLWWTIRQLKSKEPWTRTRAIDKLVASTLRDGGVSSPVAGRVIELLNELILDEHGSVREAAVNAMGKLGIGDRTESRSALHAALGDEDRSVRNAAAAVLSRIGDPTSAKALEDFRSREDALRRQEAEREAAAATRRAAQEAEETRRMAAAAAKLVAGRLEEERLSEGQAFANCQRCKRRFKYETARWMGGSPRFCNACDSQLQAQVEAAFEFKTRL